MVTINIPLRVIRHGRVIALLINGNSLILEEIKGQWPRNVKQFYAVSTRLTKDAALLRLSLHACIWAKRPIRPVPISRLCSMKQPGVLLFRGQDGMLVHCRVSPIIKVAGTHLHTWVERATVRVMCLAQEHNTMFPPDQGGNPSVIARSGDECTNWGHRASHSSSIVVSFLISCYLVLAA